MASLNILKTSYNKAHETGDRSASILWASFSNWDMIWLERALSLAYYMRDLPNSSKSILVMIKVPLIASNESHFSRLATSYGTRVSHSDLTKYPWAIEQHMFLTVGSSLTSFFYMNLINTILINQHVHVTIDSLSLITSSEGITVISSLSISSLTRFFK